MTEDEDDLTAVAQEYIDRYGAGAIDELNEWAEIAAGQGDQASAEIWREIARVAKRLLS